MAELLIAVLAVIIVSALCSLFEAVLLSTPISHVESLVSKGSVPARVFKDLRHDVDRPLSAILTLNTVANTGGAVIAGAAFVKVFGANNEHWFTVLITLAVLFLSEVLPKTVGAVYSRGLVTLVALPLKSLVFVSAPFIAVCRILTRTIARRGDAETVSGNELIILAKMGRRSGALDRSEAEVIQNILSLKTRSAKEIMTPRTVVFSLDESKTVKETLEETPRWRHSRVPVYADDFEDIVGIVLRSEVLEARLSGREGARLSDLIRPVHFVPETTSLDLILKMFLEKRQHLAVVIDEYGGLSGIITLEDVLEEILGKEIVDESDPVTDMRALARKRRDLVRKEMHGKQRTRRKKT